MRVGGCGSGGEAGGARNGCGWFRRGRRGLREHAAQAVVAGAALIADAAALQIANGGGAVVDGSVDVPIRFAAADADDHWSGIPYVRLACT